MIGKPMLATLLASMFTLPPARAAGQEPPAPPPADAPNTAPPPAAPAEPETPDFLTSITTGKVHVDLRLRYEYVDQDGFDDAHAVTNRIRLGYTTAPWHGLTFLIEGEDIRAFDDDRYNAAGLNSNPGKAVVADPEDSELNQLWANYDWTEPRIAFKVGRQRIKHDDDRFLGNVGWRQNEQTFDAARASWVIIESVTLDYAFIWDVNRIFGPDADRDFDSESHAIRAAWDMPAGVGKVIGFAYLLDLENNGVAPTGAFFSSNTYGIRYEGSFDLGDDFDLGAILSYARQSDAADNPTGYDADYYRLEAWLTCRDLGALGIGYEVLGSDDGLASFQTPLATGHAFNGWADLFLTTPPDGLEDIYIYARTTLPFNISAAIYAHWFEADDGGGDFGEEIDAVLSRKMNANWTVLAKLAVFDGNDPFPDTTKIWLQTEFTF